MAASRSCLPPPPQNVKVCLNCGKKFVSYRDLCRHSLYFCERSACGGALWAKRSGVVADNTSHVGDSSAASCEGYARSEGYASSDGTVIYVSDSSVASDADDPPNGGNVGPKVDANNVSVGTASIGANTQEIEAIVRAGVHSSDNRSGSFGRSSSASRSSSAGHSSADSLSSGTGCSDSTSHSGSASRSSSGSHTSSARRSGNAAAAGTAEIGSVGHPDSLNPPNSTHANLTAITHPAGVSRPPTRPTGFSRPVNATHLTDTSSPAGATHAADSSCSAYSAHSASTNRTTELFTGRNPQPAGLRKASPPAVKLYKKHGNDLAPAGTFRRKRARTGAITPNATLCASGGFKRCIFCKMMFPSQSALTHHLNSCPLKMTLFSCSEPGCGFRGNSTIELREHRQKCHANARPAPISNLDKRSHEGLKHTPPSAGKCDSAKNSSPPFGCQRCGMSLTLAAGGEKGECGCCRALQGDASNLSASPRRGQKNTPAPVPQRSLLALEREAAETLSSFALNSCT